MKLAYALLMILFMQVNAKTFAQKVSVKAEKVSVQEIFYQLTEQTGYNFAADAALIKKTKPVTLNLAKAELKDVLTKCFAGQSVEILLNKEYKTVVIREKAKPYQNTAIPVSGKVTDDNGHPLVGVNVRTKNTTSGGTITDNNGNYRITVPNAETILVFTYLGFATQEKKVTGNAVLNVVLKEQTSDLNEVVVTALNISREEKALGYAITTLKSEAITDAVSNNWTDALSGKVAGLNLLRSNGGPAGSNRIILRGENSLTGTSEALIVIDGVVISSSSGRSTGNGTAYMGDDSPQDYGSAINDINPNDIESITVLKGPGATALYGARGAGGAIIITTKLADPKVKGVGVSFSSGVAFETASRFPDYQYEYGQGDVGLDYYSYGTTEDGINTGAGTNAFGPKFDGQMFYQFDPVTLTTGTERTPGYLIQTTEKIFLKQARPIPTAFLLKEVQK